VKRRESRAWIILSWRAGRERETFRMDGYYFIREDAMHIARVSREDTGRVQVVAEVEHGQPFVPIPNAIFAPEMIFA
jgi:hypothetical protein